MLLGQFNVRGSGAVLDKEYQLSMFESLHCLSHLDRQMLYVFIYMKTYLCGVTFCFTVSLEIVSELF